jgi:transcriptional regulator with XRE-family HTH domain
MDIELIKGSVLKIKLKRKGIKIDDLLEAFNFNRVMVSKYVNNKAAMPATFIIKVMKYANFTVDDMIEGPDKYITYTHPDDAPIAAEPLATYLPAAIPQSDINVPLLNMSDLLDQVADLRAQMESLEQTINDLKAGKYIINQ